MDKRIKKIQRTTHIIRFDKPKSIKNFLSIFHTKVSWYFGVELDGNFYKILGSLDIYLVYMKFKVKIRSTSVKLLFEGHNPIVNAEFLGIDIVYQLFRYTYISKTSTKV
jgi:ABC-type uncharacterized transport system permease subunit